MGDALVVSPDDFAFMEKAHEELRQEMLRERRRAEAAEAQVKRFAASEAAAVDSEIRANAEALTLRQENERLTRELASALALVICMRTLLGVECPPGGADELQAIDDEWRRWLTMRRSP